MEHNQSGKHFVHVLFFHTIDQDISRWDISNIVDMSTWTCQSDKHVINVLQFYQRWTECHSLSRWNTSTVTNISHMFYLSTSFDQDISTWDVSNVEDMLYMFSCATDFHRNLSTWNMSKVTNLTCMFDCCLDCTTQQ
jgi:surface protein